MHTVHVPHCCGMLQQNSFTAPTCVHHRPWLTLSALCSASAASLSSPGHLVFLLPTARLLRHSLSTGAGCAPRDPGGEWDRGTPRGPSRGGGSAPTLKSRALRGGPRAPGGAGRAPTAGSLSFSDFLSLILFFLPRPFPSPRRGGREGEILFAAVAHKVASAHPAPGICAPCAPSPGRAARICRAPPQSDKAQRGAPGGTRGSEGARAGGAGPRCAGWGRLRAPRGSGGGEHRVHPPPRPVLKQRPGDCGLRNVSSAWQAGAALVTICFQ